MELWATKNWSYRNSEEKFGFGDLENLHNHYFPKIERIL